MLRASPWQWLCLTVSIQVCLGSLNAGASGEEQLGQQGWSQALEQFFGSIDKDGDGQIEPAEALQYIAANFDSPDIKQDPRKAAQQMSKNLDGSDNDATISKEEMEKHLRKLLKGNRVAEWLKHSAQLPQYVKAFRENSITSLDFPMLVADGGATLEADLGVKSKLHREQLLRALKRVILGIGATPSSPRILECVPIACDSVALKWQPPERPGAPPLHKYKLERQRTRLPGGGVAAPVWETANGDLDDEDLGWVDGKLQVGEYQYRMTAWNALGWSDYAALEGCNTANASLPCGRERGPAGGGALEAGRAEDATAVWKLLCSVGGMAIVSLLISARLLGGKQRQGLQEGALQKQARMLGLGPAMDALFSPPAAGSGREDGVASPASISPSSSRRELASALSRRSDGSLRQLMHNDSSNSRLSGRDGASMSSSPRRKAQAARTDLFLPNEVETFRGGSLEAAVPGSLPNVRTASRESHPPGLGGEQDVLWLDDEGMEVPPPAPALDIPASPHQTGRHACGFPGCDKSLHPIFNPRSAMTSHYCSICQNVFCHRHTSHSPHGRLGSCGMESKCICQICYEDLPRPTQERLEKSNKLPKVKKDQGANGTAAPTKEKTRRTCLLSSSRQSSQQMSDTAGRQSSGEVPQIARDQGLQRQRSGVHNWSRLRTTWHATRQFRGAGQEWRRKSRDASEQPLSGGAA